MAKKSNMLLVDLNDPKTKAVAETITSNTSRKILDYLASVENASESEISKQLSMAISTVHYHIQKLQESNLIEMSGFTYSKKGREINRYCLANKYIIITPKRIAGLKSKLKKILPIAAIPLGLAGIFKVVDILNQSFGMTTTSLEMAEDTVESEEEFDFEMIQEESSDAASVSDSSANGASFDIGFHEISIALVILCALIVVGYFAWSWWIERKNS